jgi:hypothetical protein
MEKETAVIELFDKTQVGKTILEKGKYLFEHDDERMARGEACMYIYSTVEGKQGELVASFHCTPVDRPFVRVSKTVEEVTKDPDVFRLKEVQFAGTKKGHLVP